MLLPDIQGQIATVLPNNLQAQDLLVSFLRQRRYSRRLALRCLAAARGEHGESWELRRLAVLLLENLLLRIAPADSVEFTRIVARLGLDATNAGPALRDDLRKQGYTHFGAKGFALQLRRRLRRLEPLHREIGRKRPTSEAIRGLLLAASCECQLTLARYLFKPGEVVARILSQVVTAKGCVDVRANGPTWFDAESERWLALLPAYEAAILTEICERGATYWVTPQTRSEVNSLVEYPLTTAVITIKPPGSQIEFEIKRAGVCGDRLLSVIYARNGSAAPISHWLHGSSFGWLGEREARAASTFSRIYSRIQGSPFNSCITMAIRSVMSIPHNGSETHIFDYLNSPEAFGQGFETVRGAMWQCLLELPPHTGITRHKHNGPAGMTLQFLTQSKPQQAILLNTSSFRLDRLELYLSDAGPAAYFEKGLRVSYNSEDAARFADDILREILGVYTPPRATYRSHDQYVRAALAMPANRKRADQNFCEVMRQIGDFWGTLLGVRGYTDGESFVVRNAGLRSVWSDGAWRIRIVFMDHDDLFILGKRKLFFWPHRAVLGMYRDETHIMGGPMKYERIKGEVGALKAIFRVEELVYQRGISAFREALRLAYHRALNAVESDPDIQGLFFRPFWVQIRDWDQVARYYLESYESGQPGWLANSVVYLRQKGYDFPLIRNYINTVKTYRDFIERNAFLYQVR